MAVAALLLWLCTAAVGSYLLMTAAHASSETEQPEPAEPVKVPETAAAAPAKPVRAKDRFDPPSLQQAKSEPIPGLKSLAEFAHPALGMIGFGFWLGYVISRKEMFLLIGLGVLLGTIAAGISWHLANTRDVKRVAAGEEISHAALVPSNRVLTVHAVGAGLTLLVALLIVFHV